ncbi:unnamed protein product [Auanema sp. JU1783]|nr:unnamed protein product [Auanema sp. JU1783]
MATELTELEQLLIKYMKHISTTGIEEGLAKSIKSDLGKDGWLITQQSLPTNESRFNLLATQSSQDKVRLILNTHLDTVPPYIPPTFDDENIYGRGSNDAKGQLVCMIMAANEFIKRHPHLSDQIGLLFVVGEEVDHVGMEEANHLGINPEYLIVGEPTELKFATIQKGALKVLLKANGVAGHSGYPKSGESAVHKLIPVLNDVINHKWPTSEKIGDTTYNIGLIKGGQAQNAWAESAEANIFFRVTTSVEDIMQQLQSIVGDRVEIEVLGRNSPVILSPNPLGYPEESVAFNTDLPYYHKIREVKGKYLFGGGSIKNAHSDHEFMPRSELAECQKVLVNLMEKLLL